MKKWLIALCCVLAAAVIAFVVVMNKNTSIDNLTRDLGELQEEYNSLKLKNEKDGTTIQDLNQQVEGLTAEKDNLTAEKDKLTAENSRLNETLESLNNNLSSSQQKLQGVMYILTNGEQGTIDGILSAFMKVFSDVSTNSAYFEAVDYVNEHKLMNPLGDEVFGVSEKATLGEFADSLYRLYGKTGTTAEAAEALLKTEQAWIASQVPLKEEAAEEQAETSEEPPAEEPAEAAAEETVEAAEEAAPETEKAAEPDETAETPAEPAPEEKTAAEEPAGAEDTAEEAETVTDKAPEGAEENASQTTEPAEADEGLVLTRERILSFCKAICAEKETEMPEIVFPASENEYAVRGDLAIAILKLAKAEQ